MKKQHWYPLTKMGSLGKEQGEEKKTKHWVSKPSGKRKVRLIQSFLLLTVFTRTAIDQLHSHGFA